MPPWKIIFMGTPSFAIPALKRLIEAESVVALYTQPDRPKGRGQSQTSPPIKKVALEHHIPCYQFESLQDPRALKTFRSLKPDLAVVSAYGLFLPKAYLNIPLHKTINIHPSLLPKYRGAAPMQWALIHGDTQTGVTIVTVTPQMDAGDIILQHPVDIAPLDTYVSLEKKLADLSADILLEAIFLMKNKKASLEKQDESKVVLAPKLTKEMGNIPWNKSAQQILNLIRGANPWPGTHTYYGKDQIKIHQAKITSETFKGTAGKIYDISPQGISVETPQGLLTLTEVQKPNKKRLSAAEFIKGYSLIPNTYFSEK